MNRSFSLFSKKNTILWNDLVEIVIEYPKSLQTTV